MDTPRISKRSHRRQGRSNLPSIREQTANVKRQRGITDLISDFCKAHPNNVLCIIVNPPPKNSNKPKPTPNKPTTPTPTIQTPNPPTPNPPNPSPNPATTPQPTPTTPVVNTPAPTPNAPNPTPSPNSMSGTSLSTLGTSSINTSKSAPPTGVPTLSPTGASDPSHTANNPADTGTTDRGGSSDKTSAGPLGTVPFGTDPSSTVGVGNDNNLPGSTGVGNTASAAAAGTNAGPIIGGILGAVFLILVILATLVWLRQKRNRASRVAPSSEFMGANRQYPFAGGLQAQHARLSDTETRSVGSAAISPQTFYDIRRGA